MGKSDQAPESPLNGAALDIAGADYEYKVVPAPRKPKALKGIRTVEDQFAAVLAELMNQLAREKWEYLRAESLPCEEKAGLTRRVETYQTMLVFRRPFASNQTFFETMPQKRITYQKSEEDVSEQEVIFASGRRAAAASVTAVVSPKEESGTSTVLKMLRQRRARQLLDQPADYSGLWKLAAE